MTEREKIISLAVEVGIAIKDDNFAAIVEPPTWNDLDAFYHAAQAEAFEQAAQLCDTPWNGDSDTYEYSDACNECAQAIRQLGKGK